MKSKQYSLVPLISVLIIAILVSGCASKTLFQTTPNFATVYVEGEEVGTTPYVYSDKKVAGSSTMIMFRKEGFKDLYINLKRNEHLDIGALVAGIYLIVPLFWIKKYDPVHSYELQEIEGGAQVLQEKIPNNYMVGEDDQIKIIIDTIVRTNGAIVPIVLYQDIAKIESYAKSSANSLISSPIKGFVANDIVDWSDISDSDYDILIVYFNVIKKKNVQINLKNKWNKCYTITESYYGNDSNWDYAYFSGGCYLPILIKDEFGKQCHAAIYRGDSDISWQGGQVIWNKEAPGYNRLELDSDVLIFLVSRNTIPIQADFTYQYRDSDDSQIFDGQVNIILVK